MRGTGIGLLGDLVIGIVGAFIGGWLPPQLGVHLGAGMVEEIANATIGAIILLFVLRAVRGGGLLGGRALVTEPNGFKGSVELLAKPDVVLVDRGLDLGRSTKEMHDTGKQRLDDIVAQDGRPH